MDSPLGELVRTRLVTATNCSPCGSAGARAPVRWAWCKAVGSSHTMRGEASLRALTVRLHRRAVAVARPRRSRPRSRATHEPPQPDFDVSTCGSHVAMSLTPPPAPAALGHDPRTRRPRSHAPPPAPIACTIRPVPLFPHSRTYMGPNASRLLVAGPVSTTGPSERPMLGSGPGGKLRAGLPLPHVPPYPMFRPRSCPMLPY